MRAHLRYLRYVLLHKLYVFRAGLAVVSVRGEPAGAFPPWTRWLLRLALHDLSKFRPSEWGPYVAMFYGPPKLAAKGYINDDDLRQVKAQFNRAWLLHIHRNPHHWQHWVLHEDSGKTLVLLPEAWIVDEMVADWLGAGTKILRGPSLMECVAETITWYAANHTRMQLRQPVRDRVEETLMLLAERYGLVVGAMQMKAAEQARQSLVIPGR